MVCLVVADDLTGACDAAVQFATWGLKVEVAVAGHATTAVVGVSTESRAASPAEIVAGMAAVAAEYPVDQAGLVFKKIDSTLRGNVGWEVASAMRAFGCEAAVVCPAFPRVHRVVQGGLLQVKSAEEFAPIEVAERLGAGAGEACVPVLPAGIAERLEGGARMVSVDAACEEDLAQIASAALPLGRRVLWAGAGGLASALAQRLGPGPARKYAPARGANRGTLFCIGSDHPVTLGQQSALVKERGAVLVDPQRATAEGIAAALALGRPVILPIPRGQVSAEQVRGWIATAPAGALVLSGGDTASLVCAALGVRRIRLCAEIVAGVPWGVVRGGGFEGRPVASKSGGFGERDALIRVADFFHG